MEDHWKIVHRGLFMRCNVGNANNHRQLFRSVCSKVHHSISHCLGSYSKLLLCGKSHVAEYYVVFPFSGVF